MAKRKLTDLSGDGKVTRKDVLIGRGVIKAKKGGSVKKKKTKSTVNKAGNYTNITFLNSYIFFAVFFFQCNLNVVSRSV